MHLVGNSEEHLPVLPQEVLTALFDDGVKHAVTVVDGTFGAGGHARLISAMLPHGSTYIGVDRDPTAEPRFRRFADEFPQVDARLIGDTFDQAFLLLCDEGVSADAVILDLGVSSMQIDDGERGFAYMRDGPLDMRMDQSSGVTAAEVCATMDESELANIIWRFGDEKSSRRIASEIVKRREGSGVQTTSDLARLITDVLPRGRGRRGHPAKRTFQALRMYVNDELGSLDRGLDAALSLTSPGGRIAAITFHSHEDRMVKQRFRKWLGQCVCPPGMPVCGCERKVQVKSVTRSGGVTAADSELQKNPRASSARLRAVQRVVEPQGGSHDR